MRPRAGRCLRMSPRRGREEGPSGRSSRDTPGPAAGSRAGGAFRWGARSSQTSRPGAQPPTPGRAGFVAGARPPSGWPRLAWRGAGSRCGAPVRGGCITGHDGSTPAGRESAARSRTAGPGTRRDREIRESTRRVRAGRGTVEAGAGDLRCVKDFAPPGRHAQGVSEVSQPGTRRGGCGGALIGGEGFVVLDETAQCRGQRHQHRTVSFRPGGSRGHVGGPESARASLRTLAQLVLMSRETCI